jgi:hypothetical protein
MGRCARVICTTLCDYAIVRERRINVKKIVTPVT